MKKTVESTTPEGGGNCDRTLPNGQKQGGGLNVWRTAPRNQTPFKGETRKGDQESAIGTKSKEKGATRLTGKKGCCHPTERGSS